MTYMRYIACDGRRCDKTLEPQDFTELHPSMSPEPQDVTGAVQVPYPWAVVREHEGTPLHFCSPKCLEAWATEKRAMVELRPQPRLPVNALTAASTADEPVWRPSDVGARGS